MNTPLKYASVTLFIFSLGGCMPSNIKLVPGADQVIVSNHAPGDGYTQAGPISVSHGTECGKVYSDTGSVDSVIRTLKNKAAASNIDYIRIDELTEPVFKRDCLTRRFSVAGIAYRSNRAATLHRQPLHSPIPATAAKTEVVTSSTPNRPPWQNQAEPASALNTEQLNRELRTLHKLKSDGIISEPEFNELKAILIGKYQ